MTRTIPFLVAMVPIALAGAAHGLWTDRWGWSDEPAASAARLSAVPVTLGEWEGQPIEIPVQERERAAVAGCLARRYTHRRTGEELSVVLVCGRPGPVAVHPPEVCYGGAGYTPAADPEVLTVAGQPPAAFKVATFTRPGVTAPGRLRIFWSWSATGAWETPRSPRWTFAGERALYKLYLIRQLPPTEEPPAADPAVAFLHLLLPELQRALFARPSDPQGE
jgi:hypothetical protein